jgi:hypothetical protein
MNDTSDPPLPGETTSGDLGSSTVDLRKDVAHDINTSDLAKSLRDYEVRTLHKLTREILRECRTRPRTKLRPS